VVGVCECDYVPSGAIKCGEFLDWLQTGWILKKGSALWSKEVYVLLKKFSVSSGFLVVFCISLRDLNFGKLNLHEMRLYSTMQNFHAV
jgi:hypothetical protein